MPHSIPCSLLLTAARYFHVAPYLTIKGPPCAWLPIGNASVAVWLYSYHSSPSTPGQYCNGSLSLLKTAYLRSFGFAEIYVCSSSPFPVVPRTLLWWWCLRLMHLQCLLASLSLCGTDKWESIRSMGCVCSYSLVWAFKYWTCPKIMPVYHKHKAQRSGCKV